MPEQFQYSDDDREIFRLKNEMEELVLNPKFQSYARILEGQIRTWTELVCAPGIGVDGAFKNEFNKGTLYGIRLILDLPHRIIREAKDLVNRQESTNERPSFTQPGQSFTSASDGGTRVYSDSPESIAEQLGEPVGPDARVTADSNT